MNKTNAQLTTIPPHAPAPADSTPPGSVAPAAANPTLFSGSVPPVPPPAGDSIPPALLPPPALDLNDFVDPSTLLDPEDLDSTPQLSASAAENDWFYPDGENFEASRDSSQDRGRWLFIILFTAVISASLTTFLVKSTPTPEVVKAAPKAKATAPAEVKATDTDADDENNGKSSSTSPSKLHEEELPQIPKIDEFTMTGINMAKLVAELKREEASAKTRKAAKARLVKLGKCLKATKAKITRNLFRKGKMFGSWAPSRELKNGKCRTLKYTRKLEANAEVFHNAIAELLKAQIQNYTLSTEYNDVKGTVTITLLTPSERAEMKWEDRKAVRLAKAKAKQVELARKLARTEIRRRELANERYVPRGSAAKLINDGKFLWKEGMKGEAKEMWRKALKANPTKTQRRKIKRYLSLQVK